MSDFKKYRRTQIAEMRPVSKEEVESGKLLSNSDSKISISEADIKNGSPKIGDMIARNPNNHDDQWLVAEQYFKENFEPI